MTGRMLAKLVRQNLRRGWRSALLSLFGITVGIAALAFFLALGSGVRRSILSRLFPSGQLEVVPARSTLEGPFSLLPFKPRPLTDEVVAVLRRRPEVRAAYRRMKMAFPARASGGHELLGRDVHAELIAEGIDARAMAGESLGPVGFAPEAGSHAPCGQDSDCRAEGEYCVWDEHRCERPIPAVVSPFMLELYNGAIAPAHGLPKISPFLASQLRGFTFQVELGRSFLGSAPNPQRPVRQRRLMVVGISPHAAQLALTVPIDAVAAWNAEYAGAQAGQELSSVLLELNEGADAGRLAAAVRELGFAIADSGAERASLVLTLLTLLFALISSAIVTVAAINIAHTFFRTVAERRRELGVLRSVGATSSDVQRMVLCEAAGIGLGGGLLGLGIARLAAFIVDVASRTLVPDFPFKPASYFSFDASIVLGALGCAIAACLLGAYVPARAAARLDPALALTLP